MASADRSRCAARTCRSQSCASTPERRGFSGYAGVEQWIQDDYGCVVATCPALPPFKGGLLSYRFSGLRLDSLRTDKEHRAYYDSENPFEPRPFADSEAKDSSAECSL